MQLNSSSFVVKKQEIIDLIIRYQMNHMLMASVNVRLSEVPYSGINAVLLRYRHCVSQELSVSINFVVLTSQKGVYVESYFVLVSPN